MASIKRLYAYLATLNILALGISIFLLYEHFRPEVSDICILGQKWNCDIVNKSIYSEIFGIPVALLGILAYLALLVFSLRGLKKDQTRFLPWATAFAGAGMAFALYLTGVETFVLKTYCAFCVMQQIIIAVEFMLLLFSKKITSK